jgi:hypothetical protein
MRLPCKLRFSGSCFKYQKVPIFIYINAVPANVNRTLKGPMSRDFCFRFFFSCFPQPLSTTPPANFATGTAGVVDTGGKFAKKLRNGTSTVV